MKLDKAFEAYELAILYHALKYYQSRYQEVSEDHDKHKTISELEEYFHTLLEPYLKQR